MCYEFALYLYSQASIAKQRKSGNKRDKKYALLLVEIAGSDNYCLEMFNLIQNPCSFLNIYRKLQGRAMGQVIVDKTGP